MSRHTELPKATGTKQNEEESKELIRNSYSEPKTDKVDISPMKICEYHSYKL